MDGNRFDRITRELGTGRSRRSVLKGLAVAAAAGVGLRGRGRVLAGQEKQELCHVTGDPNTPYVVISVAEPAWQTHLDHGDTPFLNCCVDADCDDGSVCNGQERCVNGACQPGTPLVCDDGNPCTENSCDPVGGCQHAPVAAGTSCDDGNVCNGQETCDGNGTCQPGTPLVCDDGNPCTANACDPATGCHFPNVVCIAPATCGGGGTAGVCGCPTTTLTVQANNPNYTPTGVILPVGGQVQITASGTTDVCGGNDPNCVTGPDGSIVNCGPFTCGTFIGRIGVDGTPFVVGDSLLLTAPSAGELFLHVFDQPLPGYFDDNTGFYDVTINCPD